MRWADTKTDTDWQPWFAWYPVREQVDYGPKYRWLWLEVVYRKYSEARDATRVPLLLGGPWGDQYVYVSKEDPMRQM